MTVNWIKNTKIDNFQTIIFEGAHGLKNKSNELRSKRLFLGAEDRGFQCKKTKLKMYIRCKKRSVLAINNEYRRQYIITIIVYIITIIVFIALF